MPSFARKLMPTEKRQTGVLKLRIDPELLELVKEKAKALNMDVSTFVRWCILTGIVLGDLNSFVRSKVGKRD
jgi:predicted HicB family RNase H-like nuclease